MPANNRIVVIASLLASVNAKNSVSVEDIVTVNCFDVFQAIEVPYKVIM